MAARRQELKDKERRQSQQERQHTMKTPTKILCLLFIAAMAALYCFNTVWSCHLEAMAAKLPILTLEEQNNQHLFWLGARSMWFAITRTGRSWTSHARTTGCRPRLPPMRGSLVTT